MLSVVPLGSLISIPVGAGVKVCILRKVEGVGADVVSLYFQGRTIRSSNRSIGRTERQTS
jgi:hypothetical protein